MLPDRDVVRLFADVSGAVSLGQDIIVVENDGAKARTAQVVADAIAMRAIVG